LSAHKIGGPQGVGAIVRRDSGRIFAPLVPGGGQEGNARAGTENVAAIAGFGAAAAEAAGEAGDNAAGHALRQRLEGGLVDILPATVIFGAGAPRLPNTV